uniref:Uncharacterized protein n=1 Tax=Oryza sativa subsp. japonica TaxID=39947 RepID=Q6Z3S7_ORYSJ|nr:hypothetical protein [Oryza sativa Japonica Group]BAD10166.1 hypothetical protein [Oryza sativa Japonica Group]
MAAHGGGDLEAAAAAQYHACRRGRRSARTRSAWWSSFGRRCSRDCLLWTLALLGLTVLLLSTRLATTTTLRGRFRNHDLGLGAFSVHLAGYEGTPTAARERGRVSVCEREEHGKEEAWARRGGARRLGVEGGGGAAASTRRRS